LQRVKVLLAEDETGTRVLLTGTLRRWGYDVVAVTDGASALEALRTSPPAVLVTDWEMPGLDGPSLAERVRDAGLRDHVHILLLTQHTDSDSLARGLAAGVDDFAAKPFDPLVLRTRLAIAKRLILLRDQLDAARRLLAGEPARAVLGDVHRRAASRRRGYALFAGEGARASARDGDLVVCLDGRDLRVTEGAAEAARGGAFHDGATDESLDAVLARAYERAGGA
jgi:DNA-binding response OmpR family regulator